MRRVVYLSARVSFLLVLSRKELKKAFFIIVVIYCGPELRLLPLQIHY